MLQGKTENILSLFTSCRRAFNIYKVVFLKYIYYITSVCVSMNYSNTSGHVCTFLPLFELFIGAICVILRFL